MLFLLTAQFRVFFPISHQKYRLFNAWEVDLSEKNIKKRRSASEGCMYCHKIHMCRRCSPRICTNLKHAAVPPHCATYWVLHRCSAQQLSLNGSHRESLIINGAF